MKRTYAKISTYVFCHLDDRSPPDGEPARHERTEQ